MSKSLSKILTFLTLFILSLTTVPVSAQAPGEDLNLESEASMVVDFETGRILHQDQADEVVAIASLTKMLVQYLVFEDIEAGKLSWEDPVEVSPFLEELSTNFILANVPLSASRTYTVRELYQAMSIYSANAATIALAEHMEGSEEAFVHRMRDLVQDFGIQDAHLVNTTGLHNSFMEGEHISDSHEDDENLMSARSVMIIAHRLLTDHPEVLETSSQPMLAFPTAGGDFVVENWNKMLPGLSHQYPGVLGMKTGTTEAAGRSFAGYVEDDRKLLTLVLNAGDINEEADRYLRFEETADLMTAHKDAWKVSQVVSASGFNQTIPVSNGTKESMDLSITEDLNLLVPKEAGDYYNVSLQYNEETLNDDGQVQAPVQEGQDLGQLVVELNEPATYLDGEVNETIEIPVVAGESVDRLSLWDRFWQGLSAFFNQLGQSLAF